MVFGVTVALFLSAGLEIIFCSELKSKFLKRASLFCSENSNVFIYVENSVFFKYRRVILTHLKNLNSYFENFEISAPL